MEKYDQLYGYARRMEDNIYSHTGESVHQANRFLEVLIDQIFDEESITKQNTSLDKKISKLTEYGVIDRERSRLFTKARKNRNEGIHGDPEILSVLELNKTLFFIAIWFYDKYSFDDDFKKPYYVEPRYNNPIEKEVKDLKAQLKEIKNNQENPISSPISDEIHIETTTNEIVIKEDLNPQMDEEIISNVESSSENIKSTSVSGSYLIDLLYKLNISSKESIDDSEGLDDFKEYIHIDRDIQDNFYKKIVEAGNKNEPCLIMLTGSVGDGKSHLLSYMKSKHPEIMNSFTIHNDATESFDPNLTAIETLLNVLEPFNDTNFESNSNKLILAINLGILSNLLEDENFKTNFTKLNSLLDEVNIFNSDNLSKRDSSILSIINFSDYQLFELNEEGPSSSFLEELFSKIVNKSLSNPFYSAYIKDIQNNVCNPTILNYEMLMNEDVSNTVIQVLIKYIIKNKKLVSTRELINFIYEILVPSNVNDSFEKENVINYIDELLPVLLFTSRNRSKILRDISDDSPMDIRDKKIDDFLISLNTLSLSSVFNEYFDKYPEIDFLKTFLISNFDLLSNSDKILIKENLVYFLLFFGKEKVKKAFVDSSYREFVKCLYYYNYEPKKLKKFFIKIKNAIFKWKGILKKDIILIDELNSFRIGVDFDIDFKRTKPIDKNVKNRFRDYIQFKILLNGEECDGNCDAQCKLHNCVKLDIDYHLCESIIKINNGYQPNKTEKQNLVVFSDFIGVLLSKISNNRLLIKNKRYDNFFKFKKSYEGYSFEEE